MPSPSYPEIRLPQLAQVSLPSVRRVRLRHAKGEPLQDVPAAVREALVGSRRLAELPAGARVAVAVGSRGIAHIDTLTRTAVQWLRERGFDVFIVPAMGSHGGGTAEGQAAVLERLGITERTVGAPVHASMEVVEYGTTEHGIACCFDAHAAAADAVVPIARVKSHTSFSRPIESGLTKMMAVGLGKHRGAQNVHLLGATGYADVLPALARMAIDRSPVAMGIAVVENADKQLVTVEGVEPQGFLAADERLLKQAKTLLARLPFDQIDVLVVEWIGKEISGAGMDYAVTGRPSMRGVAPARPTVNTLAVLGATRESGGNALGLGMADFTTRAVANAVDLIPMYTNAITSTSTGTVAMPIVLADDREAIKACCATCWRMDPEKARLAVIRSTLHLDEILVSPTLYADIEGREDVTASSEPMPLEFDEHGTLLTRAVA